MRYAKIVAMSDIHGDPDRMRELLRDGGVTRHSGSWEASGTLLVFCGDYVDRGKHGTEVIREIIRLKESAPEGCGVVSLLGNHDAAMLAVTLHLRGIGTLAQESFDVFSHNGGNMAEAHQIYQNDTLFKWLKNLKMAHVEGDSWRIRSNMVREMTAGKFFPGETIR